MAFSMENSSAEKDGIFFFQKKHVSLRRTRSDTVPFDFTKPPTILQRHRDQDKMERDVVKAGLAAE